MRLLVASYIVSLIWFGQSSTGACEVTVLEHGKGLFLEHGKGLFLEHAK